MRRHCNFLTQIFRLSRTMDLIDFNLTANPIDEVQPVPQQPLPPAARPQPAPMHTLLNSNAPAPHQPPQMAWPTAADLPVVQPPPVASSSAAAVAAAANPFPIAPPQPLSSSQTPSSAEPLRPAGLLLDDDPPIDPHVVDQMGGLAFADHCKERARERFKEMKKNEHIANGEFDRMKRRKKGDTSMTPRQKYLRRLRMNQDSAAAARHAQEVYVHVLEKLVKTTEDERKKMKSEMQQLQQQNAMLHSKLSHMETMVERPAVPNDPASFYEQARKQPFDPIQVTKLIDMLTAPQTVSAEAADPNFANDCIQPTHAV